jgi:hypothetical protein
MASLPGACGSSEVKRAMLQVEIRVKGQIDVHWSSWFEGLAIEHTGGETVITGEVTDQAALYGLLARLRDLGLSLVSVDSAEAGRGEE